MSIFFANIESELADIMRRNYFITLLDIIRQNLCPQYNLPDKIAYEWL